MADFRIPDVSTGQFRFVAAAASSWIPYTPAINPGGTAANLGSGGGINGRYIQMGSFVSGQVEITWGTGGDPGAPVTAAMEVTLPIAAKLPVSPAGDYFIGGGLVGQIVGVRDRPCTVYTTGGATPTARFVAGTSFRLGTSKINASANSLVVTHSLGQQPPEIFLTPDGGVRNRQVTDGATTSGNKTVTSSTGAFTGADIGKGIAGTNIPAGTRILSIDSATSVQTSINSTGTGSSLTLQIGSGADEWTAVSATATQFTIYAQKAGGNLVAPQQFHWFAGQDAVGVLTATSPFALGANGDHIHFYFYYEADTA